jgi:hypothetical protein
VVAAGWAVDDMAANTFAAMFYNQMLRGVPFGKAILAARQVTYEQHGETNTWGAYQCYGDPDFRLTRASEEVLTRSEDFKFVSSHEMVVALNNAASRMATLAGQDIQGELDLLEKLSQVIKTKNWLDNGGVCAALGRAYGEAKCFEQAIGAYRLGLAAEDAVITLRDIEQLANFEIRHAVERWESGEKPEAVVTDVDNGIRRLECIMAGFYPGKPAESAGAAEPAANAGKTVERLSMLGSAWKRRAWISKSDRTQALGKMAGYYREAFTLGRQKGRFDPYPLLNWLTGELAQDWQKEAREPKSLQQRVPDFSALLARTRSELAAALSAASSFWTVVMQVDAQLVEALFAENLGNASDLIAQNYLEARKLGSPREFDSALDQLDFLIAMAASNRPLAKALAGLRRKLH